MYLNGKKTEDTQEILSDLNIYNKYARYLPKLNRRESWNEICYRVRDMHIKKFPELKEEIKNAFEFVKDKKLLPSMRSLQFAGKPAEINPTRIYNCSYTPCDNYKAFGEIMFLLLGGCFEKNTLIETSLGLKKISEITEEDLVLSYNEDKKDYEFLNPLIITETDSSEKQKIELVLENGEKILCTEDHLFLTRNRGWVKAIDLVETDDIENYTEL